MVRILSSLRFKVSSQLPSWWFGVKRVSKAGTKMVNPKTMSRIDIVGRTSLWLGLSLNKLANLHLPGFCLFLAVGQNPPGEHQIWQLDVHPLS